MASLPSSAPQYGWTLEPSVLVAAAVALFLFVHAFVRLRRRGRSDHASWDRLVLFVAGLAAGVLPLVSPLDPIGDHYLLSAHMLEHVLIGDVAPALMLLSLRGPLLFFFVPAGILTSVARSAPARGVLGALSRPRVAVSIWAVVIGTWHIPALYDYTLTHQTVHDLEHACFFGAGLLVWAQLIDPARHHALTRGRRLAVAASLFWMGTVLSDVLIFSFRPLYPAYAAQPARLLELSPVRDQQLAGLVMMGEQLLSLGTCSLLLLLPTLNRPAGLRALHRLAREPA